MTEPHLEVEAKFVCPQCKGNPYTLWRRQNVATDGRLLESYQHHLWPGNDPTGPPPADTKNLVCNKCNTLLRRVAA